MSKQVINLIFRAATTRPQMVNGILITMDKYYDIHVVCPAFVRVPEITSSFSNNNFPKSSYLSFSQTLE